MDHKHPTVKRIHLYILCLAVVLFLIIVLLVSPQTNILQQGKPAPTTQTQDETQTSVKGSLTLQEANNLRTVAVGQSFTLQVVADSEEEDVVGFDVLIDYPQDAITYVSASSLNPGFQVSPKNQDGYLSLLSYQLIQSQTRSIFEKTPVVEVTFTAKVKGTHTFTILPRKNNETTKFVNTKTQQVFPDVTKGELSMEVN